jgi:exodeoxyribonuclease VII small subunit
MSEGNVSATCNYLENYKILTDAAEELRSQADVDIDKLIPLVDKALSAYAACRARIDAVEHLLADRMPSEPDGAEVDIGK